MSDQAFLSHFIEEPIYLIKEAIDTHSVVEEVKKETVAVVPEETVAAVEEPKAPVLMKPLPTIGKNLKSCVILVNWTEEPIESEKELLLKILSSVKRSEDDVLITSASNASLEQIEALLAEHGHKHLIDFGTSKFSPIAHAEVYTPVQDGMKKYLKTDTLDSISKDVEKKKALWKALQEVFL